MEYGDQTEIEECGINLSGGVEAADTTCKGCIFKVMDCDIYLLDDVFSAVDAHIGSKIFKVTLFFYFLCSLEMHWKQNN